MKSILFVINTMGMGGGEKAILELLKQIDLKKYQVSLFVLTGQGELIDQIPEGVKVLNEQYFPISVLNYTGKIRLVKTVVKNLLTRGIIFKRMGYITENLWDMIRKGSIRYDKLFWKILSDGAQRLDNHYDLAVAYLEGGAAYYIASYVNAGKKAAFIHTNYGLAGYNRKLDEDSYLEFDSIFTVAENVKEEFLSAYPECKDRTKVLYNLIDRDRIVKKAKEPGGFSDGFDGFRILTVGRLVPEKAHDIKIKAMEILKRARKGFRWYVLGEGKLRKKLENQIRRAGLEKDFILLGTVNNPFPYYAQCDLYVHGTYLEGKSVAIEEAQILGCAILVSDYSGVKEQVRDGVDGEVCKLEPEALAQKILDFADHPEKRKVYGLAASKRERANALTEVNKLLELLS